MAEMIPWEEFESTYARQFSEDMGAPAKGFRMALGALIIKEKLGVSDRETIDQIRENPYLQYFLGLHEYSDQAPFDASMLVHFRKRIGLDLVIAVNESVVQADMASSLPSPQKNESERMMTQTHRSRHQVVIRGS